MTTQNSVKTKAFLPWWGYALLLMGVAFATFGASIRYGWVPYDDFVVIVENGLIRAPWSLLKLKLMLSSVWENNWTPGTWFAQSLQWSLFSGNPQGFHFVSVATFTASAAVILGAFKQLRLGGFAAFAGVLVWALHPARVESVAWLTSQKDLGNLFFVSLFVLFYWKKGGGFAGVLAFLSYTAALAFKQSSIPLIFAVFAGDLVRSGTYRSERVGWIGSWFVSRLHYILVSLGAVAIVIWANASNPSVADTVSDGGLVGQIWRGCAAMGGYVFQTFWPVALVPDPNLPMDLLWYGVAGVLTLLVALVATMLLVFKYEKDRGLGLAGLIWFVVCLVPFCGFAASPLEFATPRLLLLPHLGLAIALAALIRGLPWRHGLVRKLAPLTVVTVAFAMSLLSFSQLRLWQNDDVFFARLLQNDPSHFRANVNQMRIEHRAGDHESAERRGEYVTALRPRSPQAWFQRIAGAGFQADHEEALRLAALASEHIQQSDDLDYLRALSLRELGRNEEALETLQAIIRRNPRYHKAVAALGGVLLGSDLLSEARAIVEAGLLNQETPELLIVLAQVERAEGNEEAYKELISKLRRYQSSSPAAVDFLSVLDDTP